MKTIRIRIKTIAVFFTAILLLQGCVAYQNTPVTLEQAVQEQKRVKVETTTDETLKFKYIGFEDGQFYGIKNNPGEEVKFPIDANEVHEVLMYNKRMSTWATIAIIAIPVIVIAYIIIDNEVKNATYSF